MTPNVHTITPCPATIEQLAELACKGVVGACTGQLLYTAGIHSAGSNILDHRSTHNHYTQLIMAALTLRENTPTYDTIASHLLLSKLSSEVNCSLTNTQTVSMKVNSSVCSYQKGFLNYIRKGIDLGLIQPEMIAYDLKSLAKKIVPNLDSNLTYAELHSLSNQLLMRYQGQCFELPQYAFMRIAIALAMKENKAEARIAEIYRLLSVRSYSRISAKTFKEGAISKPHEILSRRTDESATSEIGTVTKKACHLRLII
ncbi:MAG: hypothetical protein KUG73_03630 [Pseudomonadales bacterium]|nr:hypothetical protein [Pseudomonadales bacterium]